MEISHQALFRKIIFNFNGHKLSKLQPFKDFGEFSDSVPHPDALFYVTLYVEISIYA